MATQGNSSLYTIDAGILKTDACVVLVKTEWNAPIVDALEEGCKRVFEQYKVQYQTLIVPGAVELPFAIKRHWTRTHAQGGPDAFIALGCVIKGDTPHFDYVCDTVTQGVLQLNLSLPVPTIFGVLTVNTEVQARERIGGVHGHKGEEAAITAIKMINS
ncbi:6,7-dimethyl-8-ribityllumazine synthase [Niabella soli]|uniref:6,7-dimethyl-8-ribityllumazine synthase n=1 Tax=Niabella soli DSM 19437 TaxID=929713 RepID=W0F024_9BACT|nr:6,7-dimethyl-8-ribityllumazine synthase [Niabella soli]AHF14681.1 6,7-dimethyl-8-ribityllumazine synthase [Niabella soli DSM 19437]